MVRAPGMPSAHTSTLKPEGTFSLSIGRSVAALPVTSMANGCSVDSDIAEGFPCCHEGGGDAAGLSCAKAGKANAAAIAAAMKIRLMTLSSVGTAIRTEEPPARQDPSFAAVPAERSGSWFG